ncbi:hypothetical protein PILCRDRAFT_815770 [Piloderma croceum F 1598]|uniref:Uncharacterized protein n=1 Tax=Piloderma croceum (strain F 1598) TaxID=765440 RepID=A0A0C3FQV0_PILCF|nr:hypothetical protein PILCRDRAFT_815770 [Piloderma croceum F 1598]
MSHYDQSHILEKLNAKKTSLLVSESHLLLQLAEIRSKLTELESKRANIMNTKACINSLPDDVFLHIVNIGLELDRDSNDPDSLRHEPFPALVSRVSRRWLMTVLDAPLLWTRIRCKPSHYFALERLEAYLMRSQRCPLDITFNISDVMDHSDPTVSKRVRRAVNMLVGHADRWKSFSILAGSAAYLSYTLKALRRIRTPQLAQFAVERQFKRDLRPFPSDFGLFTGGAPALSCVCLHDCNVLSDYLPNLTRITNLQLSYFSPWELFDDCDDLRRMLGMLPSLTHLSLPDRVAEDMHILAVPIELPSLLILEITSSKPHPDVNCMYKLCISLSTPSLNTLIFNLLGSFDMLELLRLSREKPLSLRYPALRTLEIRWGFVVETDEQRDIIKDFMQAFSNITHLTMWSKDHDGQFDVVMKHLTEDAGNPFGPQSLWPHLKSITIQSPFAADLDVVSAMISARIAARRPIDTLILDRVAWRWYGSVDQPAEACSPPSNRRLEQIQDLGTMVNLEVKTGRAVFKAMETFGMSTR